MQALRTRPSSRLPDQALDTQWEMDLVGMVEGNKEALVGQGLALRVRSSEAACSQNGMLHRGRKYHSYGHGY